MTEKPRILIVDDTDIWQLNYVLQIRELVDVDVVMTWDEFDARLANGIDEYAVAIIMPLVRTPRHRNFLDAIRMCRDRAPNIAIFSYLKASTFHADVLRAGATHVALRPRDVEWYVAQHLKLPYSGQTPHQSSPASPRKR